jgi:membrane-associated phospholipid phosphatase
MPLARQRLLLLLFCILLIAIAGVLLDRPLALWVHDRLYQSTLYLVAMQVFALYDLAGVALLVVALLALVIRRSPPAGWGNDFVTAATAGLAALIVAESLKFAIGRPAVYPDFLVSGVTGLRPFHKGVFPSATTAIVTAIVSVAWRLRPRARALWAAVFLAAPLAILITNSHWLSDVIAGGWLGAALGLWALRVSHLRTRASELP